VNEFRSKFPGNSLKSSFLAIGTTLVKESIVKPLDNHKIITLAIGIFVAIVIALTIFIQPAANTSVSHSANYLQVPLFALTRVAEAAINIIF
jgi:hypothetical protein